LPGIILMMLSKMALPSEAQKALHEQRVFKGVNVLPIEKIAENLNIPKQILDKTEALLKTLFGPSFQELGGIIADQVRLRRFMNQITIFNKAQEKLLKNNIQPQKLSLKILAPLIEFSSLEEEITLQNKWANLISHILGGNKEIVFQQNCMTILNRISSNEADLLDKLHILLSKKRIEKHKIDLKQYEIIKKSIHLGIENHL
jgi:hypothetical protein